MIISLPSGLGEFVEQVFTDKNLPLECVGAGGGSYEFETTVDIKEVRAIIALAVQEAMVEVEWDNEDEE